MTATMTERHFPSLNLRFNHFAEGVEWQGIVSQKKSLVNCYAYALNLPDSASINPGELANPDFRLSHNDITPQRIHSLLEQDGLERISAREAFSGRVHAVACLLRPYTSMDKVLAKMGIDTSGHPDYHFLRFDHQDGAWSHAYGHNCDGPSDPPQNTDDRGRIITDPERAEFDDHPEFLGYYAFDEHGISYIASDPVSTRFYLMSCGVDIL